MATTIQVSNKLVNELKNTVDKLNDVLMELETSD